MLVLSASFIDKMAKATVPVIVRRPPLSRCLTLTQLLKNLHPSLPAPNAIKGANAISGAYEAFQKGEIEKTVSFLGTSIERTCVP